MCFNILCNAHLMAISITSKAIRCVSTICLLHYILSIKLDRILIHQQSQQLTDSSVQVAANKILLYDLKQCRSVSLIFHKKVELYVELFITALYLVFKALRSVFTMLSHMEGCILIQEFCRMAMKAESDSAACDQQ